MQFLLFALSAAAKKRERKGGRDRPQRPSQIPESGLREGESTEREREEGNDLRVSRGGSRLMPSAFPQQRFGLRILGETWRVHSTLAGSVNPAI